MRVIVVGAGILGASAAYHLARAGAKVVLLDDAREGRATAAGAGIVCPWASANEDPDWYAIAAGGARFYPGLVQALADLGEADLGYRRVGALCAPGDEDSLEIVEARLRARAVEAPEAGEITRLPPEEARALFPALHPDRAAIHVAGGARLDGRRLAAALRRAAVHHGAIEGGEATALTAWGERVTGVRVEEGPVFEADAVLLAAGAWAPPLLAPLGLRLDVPPQRGQIAHLALPGQDTSHWPVLLPGTSHYLLAFDDSRVVVGATRETGSGFDHRLTAAGVHEVLGQALAVAPGLGHATLLEVRIGFRPMSPDGKPLLGPVPSRPGLWIGNGLGPNGLTQGPFAGALLADAILGRPTALGLAAYDPMRAMR
ncbi:FAD-binding oxidoreductase [Roseomonas sp. OT10]|uniref:NAD(P)/FAD-dependent oxidoreductase n=1 Tax=Roseomonas cutis TaxID=2897332 RepID=UPI001E570423|nr:FAD-dependent oxidoreductase [Roseomonas sp. OT10]UFN46961.1 FAD-binding oxidoreductase [Roseomonas sp. OT10]